MLRKLQRKTLIHAQIAGYTLALLTGMTIATLCLQLYCDLRPVLTQQTQVFKAHTVTVSKNITLFKTANKDAIYFSEKELDNIKQQEFVKDVAPFNCATFSTSAAISFGGQCLSTDLFFESLPDRYLDVQSDQWRWDSTSSFLPVIIPQDYVSLYNFGFAESQSLPVISEAMLSQVTFNILIEGNGKQKVYNSRIVGLSGAINSILVPENFLLWANNVYGTNRATHGTQPQTATPSRLLVEFDNASDERIPQFFENNGLNINKSELESSKMAFFFRMAMLFVIVIASVIITLSVAFIILSVNLIAQKNRDLFVNLHNIGYSVKVIGRFYRQVITLTTLLVAILSVAAVATVRNLYADRLASLFVVDGGILPTLLATAVLTLVILLAANVMASRAVRSTCSRQ